MDTGHAPHFTEIAKKLGVSPDEGRKRLHELIALKIPGCWLYPNTSLIASFAPFNNIPTQYRITVDGKQIGFGQWGFESLAVCWLFPGKTVRIDSVCLDCGDLVAVELADGNFVRIEPAETVGYVAVPLRKWMEDWAYTWSTMNLFRSEEHVRNWSQFDSATAEGIIPLKDVFKLFSGKFFRRRLDDDWLARSREYFHETLATLEEIGKTGPFWQPPR
jgi:hypothetical protein